MVRGKREGRGIAVLSILLLLIMMISFSLSGVAFADTIPQEETLLVGESNLDAQEPTEWIYKIENGRMYKRLWNNLTQQWIGDWILC